jgi:hypothetical protein
MVKGVLHQEGICEVIPLQYGYFDVIRFWWPLWTREKPINKILWRVEHAVGLYPGAELIIVAHSFGTYAIATILERKPHIRPSRMILCGSVISSDYRWDKLSNCPRVINECGNRDIWPVLAQAASWGYGASGTFGFGTPGIVDRFHDIPHGGYFKKSFVDTYWTPWISSGAYVPSPFESSRPEPPWWRSILTNLPLQWLLLAFICLVIILSAVLIARRLIDGPGCDPSSISTSVVSFDTIPKPDRPSKEKVAIKPDVDPSLVTFSYKNDTGRDICLVLYSFWRHYGLESDPVGALPRDPWFAIEMKPEKGYQRYDKFESGTGWFAVFVYDPGIRDTSTRLCYLGTYNIFSTKKPTLVVSQSADSTRPYSGVFTEE